METSEQLVGAYRRAKSALESHAIICKTCKKTFNCPIWGELNDAQHNASVALRQAGLEIPE